LKLTPKFDANNLMVGNVPNRASKNPIIGVIRCSCGLPASVHDPKGKRAGYYYTICDACKTDQRSGEPRQEYIRANMKNIIEDLDLSVNAINEKTSQAAPVLASSESDPVKKPEITEAVKAPTLNESPTEDKEPVKPLFIALGAILGGLAAALI
jgi:hypothetical protein